MEIVGESLKIGAIEITKVIGKYGNKQILVKYYSRIAGTKSFNFQKYQSIFFKPEDWELLIKELRKK